MKFLISILFSFLIQFNYCLSSNNSISLSNSNNSNNSLPYLIIDGFSWAENLLFDSYGKLYISEAITGELYQIYLCSNQTLYCKDIFYSNSKVIIQFGGLEFDSINDNIIAGVTFNDKSFGLISLPRNSIKKNTYELIVKTEHQPNGLTCDWLTNNCYYTDEGTGSPEGGSLIQININTKVQTVIKTGINGADGAWIDTKTNKLYVGQLITLNIVVFDISTGSPIYLGQYDGLSSLDPVKHMLDDLTVYSTSDDGDVSKTMLLGADWTGRKIQLFSVDGKQISEVKLPDDIQLYEPTSVRWGKGPGFDPSSIYITEGGGATKRVTNRRVIQIKMF